MWLPDVNFWLALAFERHKHHVSAANWLAGAPAASCAFCRMTQQGLLRLATNPQVFGKEALRMVDAWRAYDYLFDDPRVVYSEEPDGLEATWRKYSVRRTFSPKLWNDVYLAAFAKEADFELVSFDRGLAQFKGVSCVLLS
jgi:toxin-antitoxin system PIN domain toxin